MPLTPTARIVCLGGAAIDRTWRLAARVTLGTSNPARAALSQGGVARNVAENLGRLGADVALASVVGTDAGGAAILAGLASANVDTSGIESVPGAASAEYAAVLDPDGNLVVGLAAMDLFARLDAGFVERAGPLLESADIVFAETNLSADALETLLAKARAARWRLVLDAVSVAKSARLPRDLGGVTVQFCARDEAEALAGVAADPLDLARAIRARGAAAAVVTLGADGLVVATADAIVHEPAPPAEIVDVTGAGDALVAGTLWGLACGLPSNDALERGRALARLTLAAPGAVRPDLSPALLAGTSGRPE